MNIRPFHKGILVLFFLLLTACGTTAPGLPTPPTPTSPPTKIVSPTAIPPTATSTPVVLPSLSIILGQTNDSQGIRLDQGGDMDTLAVAKGEPPIETRSTGNGMALGASDGNTIPDNYMQLNVDDKQLYGGKPSSHVRVEVDYFDEGTDTFSLQYDALSGVFAGGGAVQKTNTLTFKTAVFNLCDANFANRDNGADFRLVDNSDGAEFFSAVRVIALPSSGAQTIRVDAFGADPFDQNPDSDAIQAALDSTCSGDTVVFTSGVNDPAYTGYLIDKTLFLTGMSAKHDLTFTASDPASHALLRATADLKGFVVKMYARTRFSNAGDIDNIDFGFIDMNGGRDERICLGPDQIASGLDDNWGSWLPECTEAGDPWCLPGVLSMDGGVDWNDPTQNYTGNPSIWTTGVVVHDLTLQQGECGTALGFFSAAGTIQNVTIDTAGDHVHAAGCAYTDNDGDKGGWSDGITLLGPAQTVQNNTVINPSDIGIVFFGGKGTIITNNTILIEPGNYGAFGAIAVHPWTLGDISGLQITGNTITSEGDTRCGGLHAGINLGPHMWGGGCVNSSRNSLFGNDGSCTLNPLMENVTACTGGKCQLWAYLPTGGILTLRDNVVTGAHINYLVEGLAAFGQFVDENNVSVTPRLSDWGAARTGCNGAFWGALDRVAHHPTLEGYTDVIVHCER
jgi:parallel beta-helix repeat protein